MSLHAETQNLVDRVLQHNEAMSSGSVPLDSDFVTDLLLLENEILAFKAGVMDEASMQTLKDDLQRTVNKHQIP